MPEETVPTQFEATYPDKANKKPILLIVAVVVLALAVATMSFFLMQASKKSQSAMSQMQAELVAMQTAVEEDVATLEESIPPFLYGQDEMIDGVFSSQIREIDRITSEDALVFESTLTEDERAYRLFAVPQFGYDGTIFVDGIGMGDSPWLSLFKMHLETGELIGMEYPVEMHAGMTSLSPDQRLVAVADDRVGVETPVSIKIVDLVSGELLLSETLEEGLYFAREYNDFDGAGHVSLKWTSPNCVSANVYTDEEESSYATLRSSGAQPIIYCIE